VNDQRKHAMGSKLIHPLNGEVRGKKVD